MTHAFFNLWHLGDCLFQCLYFQRVAPTRPEDQFVLYCQQEYHGQLSETVEHLPNVSLRPVQERTPEALDCWIGAGEFWHRHHFRSDYLLFYIDWFERISAQAGLDNPFRQKKDFWFDYPALSKPTPLSRHYDFLVVNSPPKSGQFQYRPEELAALVARLAWRHSVVTTHPTGLPDVPATTDHNITITGVGNVSNQCDYHLMISTGPSWPTFNVLNVVTVRLRMILLNNIILDYGPTCHHFGHVLEAQNFLASRSLI